MNMRNFADSTAPNAPNVFGAAIGVWCNLSPDCTKCTIYLEDGALVHSVQRIGDANVQISARTPGRFVRAASVRNFADNPKREFAFPFGRHRRTREPLSRVNIRGHDNHDEAPRTERTG